MVTKSQSGYRIVKSRCHKDLNPDSFAANFILLNTIHLPLKTFLMMHCFKIYKELNIVS